MSKKAQSVTKVTTTPTRPARRRTAPPPEGTNIIEMAHAICSVTNPFCPESRNSKWPDASANQTLSIPVRQRINLTTDAEGEVSKIFTSAYPAGVLNGVTVAGVFDTNITTNYSPVFDDADSVRLVSGGIKVTPITSAMNSQGIINILELPPADDIFTEYALVDTTLKNFATYESLPLKSDKSIYSILRPSGPLAREFHIPQTTSDIVITTNDWSSVCVNVTGGAVSTVVAVVDIYMNFEVTVGVTSSLGFITTRPPGLSNRIIQGSTAITLHTGTYKGSDDSVDQSFMSKAFGYLKSAGSFLFTNRKSVARLALAGAQAYQGDYGGAAANVGSLALANHAHMDVD
jgi:hypothetical protein